MRFAIREPSKLLHIIMARAVHQIDWKQLFVVVPKRTSKVNGQNRIAFNVQQHFSSLFV